MAAQDLGSQALEAGVKHNTCLRQGAAQDFKSQVIEARDSIRSLEPGDRGRGQHKALGAR